MRAIEIVGSQAALAEALGLPTRQHLWNWTQRRVPTERCPDIERITNGAVRCEDLRRDVNWAVLREAA